MAIQTIKATMQMRNGLEEELDSDQLSTGEWAVSRDTRYVRMCFAPGIVLRMATYEAFEEDMKEIQLILATCQDIQAAVERFEQLAIEHKNKAEEWSVLSKSWAIGGTGIRDGEDSDNSKHYNELSKGEADRAKGEADRAKGEADRAASIADFDIDLELSKISTNPVANKTITEKINEMLWLSGGVSIPANADLDDAAYWEIGNYYCYSSASAITIKNCPIKTEFIMDVSYGNGTSYPRQTIHDNDNGNIWCRRKSSAGSDFGKWRLIATDQSTKANVSDIPESLKNPKSLIFTGAVAESYDGSESKTVSIPSGVNSLLATDTGFWLDATQGKVLDDKIADLKSYILGVLSDLNISKSFVKDNITIPADGYLSIDIPIDIPEGYKTRSLGSISILNASSSGANSSRCFYYTNTWSGNTATVAVRNTSAAAAKIKVIVRMEFTKIL